MRIRDLFRIRSREQDIAGRIRDFVCYDCAPASIIDLDIPFQRDYSDPKDSRVRAKSGNGILSVEEFVLEWFDSKGDAGFRSENFFWESFILYAFFNELVSLSQRGYFLPIIPGEFWEKMPPRKYLQCIRNRFESKQSLRRALKSNYQRHLELDHRYGLHSDQRVSPWFHYLPSQVDEVIDAFDLKQLLSLIDTLLHSKGSAIEGMPDLLIFQNDVPKFCEVKSPNDVVRPAQSRLFQFLAHNLGITVMIANLVEQDEQATDERETYYAIRQEQRALKAEARQRIEATLGTRIKSTSIPSIPCLQFDSGKFMDVLQDCRIFGLKFLWEFVRKSVSDLTDTEVNESFINELHEVFNNEHSIKKLRETYNAESAADARLQDCISAYLKRTKTNKTRNTERQVVEKILATHELGKSDRLQAIAEYNESLDTILGDASLENRLPSYVVSCYIRLSILYERERRYQDCLYVIDGLLAWLDYVPTLHGEQQLNHITKEQFRSVIKRRERIVVRVGLS
jgi:hypothetical protein